MTATVRYLGNLRCESTHIKSGNTFYTDAPLDNHGKGEAFSPTDTIAAALASCMLTVMGIKAQDLEIHIAGSEAAVTKHMATDPRRISQIDVVLTMQGNCDKRTQLILERTALTCPVYNSLHTDVKKLVTFIW
jgi:uncharacterized OsmC-like protein